ncbi:MAG: lipopolysaccharide kinase [Gammaproteobacteria bacterium]|nr:lipopolysaccharide kinase [Gammaproteobacteria bacterium]
MNQDQFIDEYHYVHRQDKELGKGGQGVVFRTKDPDLAIKLVTDEAGNPLTQNEHIRKYSERFERVKLLPIPQDINISTPVALLKEHAGYVMPLLNEMVPFSDFWLDGKVAKEIKREDIPSWLLPKGNSDEEISQENEDKLKPLKEIVHYHNTGGLRRRLHVLYKCASLLARLHGTGLVYGDISPNNIFISNDSSHSSVWLIDADNIRFEISSNSGIVYTPKYGAPELVQEKDGARPISDCHAFAVVAFYLLALIHPFIGQKVDGSDEDDWADEENDGEGAEDRAYAGIFPWVDDEEDDSNASMSGLPRVLLLTPKLQQLFQQTLGAGRGQPWLRPSIYHWPEALAQATDLTVQCPNCSMSYYHNYKDAEIEVFQCPYCNTPRPAMIKIESYPWQGDQGIPKEPIWSYTHEVHDNSLITLPNRVLTEFSMVDSDKAELTIKIAKDHILLKKVDNSSLNISIAVNDSNSGDFKDLYSQSKLIIKPAKELNFWLFINTKVPRLVSLKIERGIK